MQGQPTVHTPWDRDGSDVVTERHLGTALGPQRRRVCARACPAGRVEGEDLAVAMNEREQIAAHSAQVRRRDSDRRIGRDRRVDGISTEDQGTEAGLRRQLIGAGHHSV